MKTETEKFKEFNELYGLEQKPLTHEQACTTAGLIADELEEFLEEFYHGAVVAVTVDGHKIEKPNLTNAGKELEDIRYITGQQMTQVGMTPTLIGSAVHNSNMSKRIPKEFDSSQLCSELATAKERYPNAAVFPVDGGYTIKCQDTGKLIKPTTYQSAVIADFMVGA